MKIDILNEIESRPWIVSAILFLVIGMLSTTILFVPLLKKKASLVKRIDFEKKRAEYGQTFVALQEGVKKQSEHFMGDDNIASLIQLVSQMARESGVTLTSMTPVEPERGQDLVRLSVAMECSAGYHAIGKFLARLESHEKFLKIDEVNIEGLGNPVMALGMGPVKTGRGIGNVTIKISSYKALIDI